MRTRLAIAGVSLLAVVAIAAMAGPAAASGTSAREGFAAGLVRLDGAQETQAADPDGRGIFGYVAADRTLCYLLTAARIEPASAAHIHTGGPGVAGGIVVGLDAPTSGVSANCITAVPDTTPDTSAVLTQSELAAIIANPGGFYVNVHNTPFPAGAIRGQLR